MTTVSECIPIVTVSDINSSKEFYVETLGFKVDFDAGEIAGLLHGSVMLYLIDQSSENQRQPAGSANLSFMTDEVDELCERCRRAGAEVFVEPDDRPYGQRDFAVRDRDGNVLVFACAVSA